MSLEAHNYTQLPRRLLNELSVPQNGSDNGGRRSRKPPTRKEIRKGARLERRNKSHLKAPEDGRSTSRATAQKQRLDRDRPATSKANTSSSIAKSDAHLSKIKTKTQLQRERLSKERSTSPSIPRSVKKKLAEDDAAIEALEGALGLKGKTRLPKSFEDDGLDELLDDVEDASNDDETRSKKRKRQEAQEWLSRKRSKAQRPESLEASKNSESFSSESEDEEKLLSGSDKSWSPIYSDRASLDPDFQGPEKPMIKGAVHRENPYVAPTTDRFSSQPKYRPPSLRDRKDTLREDTQYLRRQIKGFLNRLSTSNLPSIVAEFGKLYQNGSRHQVSACILEMFLEILSDPATLQDSFIILHCGFLAALYKTLGTDFGAQAIESFYGNFSGLYVEQEAKLVDKTESTEKRLLNLVHTFAELYNFHIIASNLIFDLIRLFLKTSSELNTELLLKLLRNCGQQLRQDDPTSLKSISVLLQERTASAEELNLSVRTKFMIETIEELQKKRPRHNVAASTIASEHRVAMRRQLGALIKQSTRAAEPLRIGLQDLQNADKVGKWWLVGSSFKDPRRQDSTSQADEDEDDANEIKANGKKYPNNKEDDQDSTDVSTTFDFSTNLAHLAQEQRMNTDIRRSIFIAIMSSTDYTDAYTRLKKLHLKKSQELEIPKILLRCTAVEQNYNPFYTLLARRLCEDRKLRMAFQFGLWDLFKRMGEGAGGSDDDEYDEDDEDDEGTGDDTLSLRSLVNLGKVYGTLISGERLGIGVLKVR